MSRYSDLLKDPRWQRRRLEVLNKADFRCSECLNTKQTLHIHHLWYEWNRKPWDYPDKPLKVLCKNCHDEYTEMNISFSRLKKVFVEELGEASMWLVLGYMMAALNASREYEGVGPTLPPQNLGVVRGMSDYLGVSAGEIRKRFGM